MSKSSKASMMVTDMAAFYRCDGVDGPRFYPFAASARPLAIEYNGGNMPATVRGHGVYDTTLSTAYAVALYSDRDAANEHIPADAPSAPTGMFADDEANSPEKAATDAEWDDGEPRDELRKSRLNLK